MLRAPLFPLESALLPYVGKAQQEFEQEDHHRDESRPADILERDAPREHERGFEGENDKEDCNEVVTDIELHPRILKGFEAALVGCLLRSVRLVGAKHLAYGD